LQAGCSDNSIHQHLTETDHFFQKTPITDYSIRAQKAIKIVLQNQAISDQFEYTEIIFQGYEEKQVRAQRPLPGSIHCNDRNLTDIVAYFNHRDLKIDFYRLQKP